MSRDPVPWQDTLSALATVAAVLLALTIALAPLLYRWWKRARLEIELGDIEPFVRDPERKGLHFDQLELRIGVHNKGRGEAREVRLIVERWLSVQSGSPALLQDLDPAYLHWVSRNATSAEAGTTIPPDGRDYAKLAMLYRHGTELLAFHPTNAPIVNPGSARDHLVYVHLTCDNGRAVRRIIGFTAEHDHWFSNLHFAAEAPDVLRGGMVALVRQLARGGEGN